MKEIETFNFASISAKVHEEESKMCTFTRTFFAKRAELTEKYIKRPTDAINKGNQSKCNHLKNGLSYYIKVDDIVCKCQLCGKEKINPDYIRDLCEKELGYSYQVPNIEYLV